MIMLKRKTNSAQMPGWTLTLLMTIGLICAPSLACADDRADVIAANNEFYSALNKMFTGDAVPMKAVWSHADDVTYMGPTGDFDHGWSAVLKNWEAQAAMKLGGHVKGTDIRVIVGRDIAVVSDFEQGENTNAKGKVERLKLRATNVYRKEGGAWKMVGHHTDTLPYLAR